MQYNAIIMNKKIETDPSLSKNLGYFLSTTLDKVIVTINFVLSSKD